MSELLSEVRVDFTCCNRPAVVSCPLPINCRPYPLLFLLLERCGIVGITTRTPSPSPLLPLLAGKANLECCFTGGGVSGGELNPSTILYSYLMCCFWAVEGILFLRTDSMPITCLVCLRSSVAGITDCSVSCFDSIFVLSPEVNPPVSLSVATISCQPSGPSGYCVSL